MIINDKDRDGVFSKDDEHCTINGERDDVNQEALWGGGWCLEWLHPPPKGFNVEGKGREREMTREREIERENDHAFIHSP